MKSPPAWGRTPLYAAAAATIQRKLSRGAGREERMRAVADALWEHLAPSGVSWAVLDLDSHQPGFFDREDVEGLSLVLGAAFPDRIRG